MELFKGSLSSWHHTVRSNQIKVVVIIDITTIRHLIHPDALPHPESLSAHRSHSHFPQKPPRTQHSHFLQCFISPGFCRSVRQSCCCNHKRRPRTLLHVPSRSIRSVSFESRGVFLIFAIDHKRCCCRK